MDISKIAKPMILLVDDDDDLRVGIAMILEVHGFEVWQFRRGEDLLSWLDMAAFDTAEFLLISDMRMPGISGEDLIRRARIANVSTLAISGYGSPKMRAELAALGCDGYLDKPINPDRLLETIYGILARGGAIGNLPRPPPEKSVPKPRRRKMTKPG